MAYSMSGSSEQASKSRLKTSAREPVADFQASMPASAGRTPSISVTARFVSFKDPDGNGWLLQEVTARLPGRVDAGTNITSSTELAAALRRAAAAYGEHEKRTGKYDENWPDWYADYVVREQAGKELPL